MTSRNYEMILKIVFQGQCIQLVKYKNISSESKFQMQNVFKVR
jgi:hypothetical protein